jgi:hypothetical protein
MNHNALAKVGLSNMEGDPARGVVYWYVGTPETSTLSNTWLQKTFTTGTHYSDMYEDMQKFMNGLPLHQAQNSIIDMTNYQGGDATLTIYYPTK